MSMSEYLSNGMDEWFEKHRETLLNGKGFTGGFKKKRYVPPLRETDKQRLQALRNIHYGNERKRGDELVKEHLHDGHVIKLWSNGNLTCDCLGWIYKRAGSQRECRHVREVYAQMTQKPVPSKTEKKQRDKNIQGEMIDMTLKALLKGGCK